MLDCDDTIEPPFFAETVPLLRAAPADVATVFCHLRLVGAAKGLLERHFNRFDLLFTNTLSSGLILRKRCWAAVGGYDESMRDGYEDWEFRLRLTRAGYRGIEVPKPFTFTSRGRGHAADRASRLHGRLWRDIRRKHAELYWPPSMLRLWRATRDGSGRVSLRKGLAALLLATVLPDALFSRLVAGVHRRSLLEGHRPTYMAEPEKTRLAP